MTLKAKLKLERAEIQFNIELVEAGNKKIRLICLFNLVNL